ncbi:hypothetical protein J1N35_002917 [Gossypium stocksii]|uniref:Uncharacterized protein n=1 Tax=Gossypium stocksii TaxID=47602 RepID=A0A9D4AP70_9ROSI|nr:hypothetical protein J1N35_002917 [Gossypium stocksii]
MEYPTPTRHSVSGCDMHLSGSMFDARNTYWGMTSTSSGWQSKSDWRRCETSTMRMMYSLQHPPTRGPQASLNGAEIVLFSEPEPVPTITEDVEGGSDDDDDKDP